jgi:hypothetical protein
MREECLQNLNGKTEGKRSFGKCGVILKLILELQM